jgi:hypothetical protein
MNLSHQGTLLPGDVFGRELWLLAKQLSQATP